MGKAHKRLCAAGTHSVWQPQQPCDQCRRERLRGRLIARIGAVCDLDGDITGGCIDAITTSTRGLESFSAQLDTHLGGTLVAPTEWFGRLLWSLHEAGATVALPTCADCGVTAKKLRRTEHGPQCSSCYAEAHKRPCSRCGTLAKICGVDDDRQPLCRRCHTAFTAAERAVTCQSCHATTAPRRVAGLTLCHPCEALVRRHPDRVGDCAACRGRSYLTAVDGGIGLCRGCAHEHVVAAVESVAAGHDSAHVEMIIDGIVTHRGMLTNLTEWLFAHPDALVDGDTAMPAVMYRLTNALWAAGATGVCRWACERCGAWCAHRQQHLCNRCWRYDTAQGCSGCDQVRPVERRGPDGEPWCASCAPHATVLFETCGGCGRDALPQQRLADGPRCESCWRRSYEPPARRCCRCNHDSPIAARWPDGPVCYRCYQQARNNKSWCAVCGTWALTPARDRDGAKLCKVCAGFDIDLTCPTCGQDNGRWTATQCSRCWVAAELAATFCAPTGDLDERLRPLYDLLVDTMTPNATTKWLDGPSATLVARMATGEIAVSHDTLDGLRLVNGADRHRDLRGFMVTAGVLDERNEIVVGVEALITRDLTSLDVTDADHACLAHYGRFEILRRLRETQARHGRRRGAGNAKGKWRAAVIYVRWLAQRQLTLTAASQGDLDRFIAGPGSTLVARLDEFINWARRNRHAGNLHIARPVTEARYDQLPQDQLAAVAARLIHVEDLDLAPRVAGLLVVLFGLTLPTITELRYSDITATPAGADIAIRGFTATIPEPAAGLVRQLADQARTPTNDTGRWLFPGHIPNQPLGVITITHRLATIDFPTILARNAARHRLARTLDPDVMRRITDISAQTANDLHARYAQNWPERVPFLAPDTTQPDPS